jgi:hypothetical protein
LILRVALLALLVASAPRSELRAQPPTACPPRGTPLISVEVVDPEARLLNPVSSATLRTEAGGEAGEAFPHHLGLTVSRVEWRTDITARSRGLNGGPVCAVPAEVRVRLLHSEHTIRLARELPAGSCLAREVLAHERRHAEVNRRTIREAGAELRIAVRAWAAHVEGRAADSGAAAMALQEDLTRALEPVLERLRVAREVGHAAIDSPEEYRRLSRVCPEDQRRLRAALRLP